MRKSVRLSKQTLTLPLEMRQPLRAGSQYSLTDKALSQRHSPARAAAQG